VQRTGLRPWETVAAKFGKILAVSGVGRHAPPLTPLLGGYTVGSRKEVIAVGDKKHKKNPGKKDQRDKQTRKTPGGRK